MATRTRVPMSAQDSLWLTMDRPNNLMIVDGAMVLGAVPSLDDVKQVVQERIVDRFPVYRRRPVKAGNGWAWEDYPAFDLDQHVSSVQLPEPADIAALQRFMSVERAKPMAKNRPLWVMFLIDNLVLDDGTPGAAVVSRFHHAMADGVRMTQVMLSMCDTDSRQVAAKVSRKAPPVPRDPASVLATSLETMKATTTGVLGHALSGAATASDRVREAASAAETAASHLAEEVAHALGDAMGDPLGSLAALQEALAAVPAQVAAAATELVKAGTHGLDETVALARHADRFVDALEYLGVPENRALNTMSSATKLLVAGQTERTFWNGTPGKKKAIAWSHPLPLEDLKAVGRAQGCTLNDVLLAAVAGGMRRYLSQHHAQLHEVLWMVPVNLKPFEDNLPEELGNYFALVILPMPLGSEDPRDRLREMHQRMERIKHSDEAVLTFGLQRGISQSPGQVAFFLTNFFANKALGVLTNVPGPRTELVFGNVPVLQVVGFAPCSGDQPMTATIFSYNGTVTVGFATDAGLVPDPDVLATHVAEEALQMCATLTAGGTGTKKSPPKPVPARGAAKKPAAKEAGAKKAPTRKASAAKSATKKPAAAKKVAAKEPAATTGATKKPAAKKPAAPKGTAQKATSQKATSRKAATKAAATKKPAATKAAPKKAAS
ncbi:MAG: WS/DGAT domain-containing protein [Candidatus Nanopelagicales bacterium]